MELDITKKPLIKSITQLDSAITLFIEVVGNKPNRIAMNEKQYNWYVKLLQDTATSMELRLKPTRTLEPTFRGIPVYEKLCTTQE